MRRRRLVERCRRGGELVNHSFITDDVDLSALVLSEGGDALRRGADHTNDLQEAIPLLEPEYPMRGVVATNVNAVKGRMLVTAINVAASNQVSVFAAIGEDGWRVSSPLFPVAIGDRKSTRLN